MALFHGRTVHPQKADKMKMAVRSLFRRLFRHVSGNAAMLVALGMPVMIGTTGLAVDTAQWFLWKRELQHAVDQGALGGAWALSKRDKDFYTGQTRYYKYRAKQEYNANLAITEDFADQPSIVLADFAGGENNSVIMTATATKKLPFSGFIMDSAVTIRVNSQASFRAGGQFNACLVALEEHDDDTLSIGGNADVKAQCGLAALSCEENAVNIDGSSTVTTGSIATCGTANVPADLEGVVTEHLTNLYDAYKDLVPPDNPTPRTDKCVGSGKKAQANLLPGTYKGLVVKCTTVLQSGVYVIDGGELDLAANYDVTGSGVLFVLKNGARMKFGGNGNGNKITLTPMTAAQLTGAGYASQANELEGILVFEQRNDPNGTQYNPQHKLNGNSQSLIEGLMYLPAGDMEVLGTADVASRCLQISARRIAISGGAILETLCPVEETIEVGTEATEVRLIA
jgi:Flp pilus assembly protein TadG